MAKVYVRLSKQSTAVKTAVGEHFAGGPIMGELAMVMKAAVGLEDPLMLVQAGPDMELTEFLTMFHVSQNVPPPMQPKVVLLLTKSEDKTEYEHLVVPIVVDMASKTMKLHQTTTQGVESGIATMFTGIGDGSRTTNIPGGAGSDIGSQVEIGGVGHDDKTPGAGTGTEEAAPDGPGNVQGEPRRGDQAGGHAFAANLTPEQVHQGDHNLNVVNQPETVTTMARSMDQTMRTVQYNPLQEDFTGYRSHHTSFGESPEITQELKDDGGSGDSNHSESDQAMQTVKTSLQPSRMTIQVNNPGQLQVQDAILKQMDQLTMEKPGMAGPMRKGDDQSAGHQGIATGAPGVKGGTRRTEMDDGAIDHHREGQGYHQGADHKQTAQLGRGTGNIRPRTIPGNSRLPPNATTTPDTVITV